MSRAPFYSENQIPWDVSHELVHDFANARTSPLAVIVNNPFNSSVRYDGLFFAETIVPTPTVRNSYHMGGRVACLGVNMPPDEQPRHMNLPHMGLVADAMSTRYPDMGAWGTLTLPSRTARAIHYVRASRDSERPPLHSRLSLAVLWPVRVINETEDA